jgi:hypothetical protein
MTAPPRPPGFDAIVRWHAIVDSASQTLARRHGARLRCARGCSNCCTDGLTVLPIEAGRIQAEYAELLARGVPAPPGRCPFLDLEGACRVYAARPYVCRTQGLPLRWLEEDDDGTVVEQRDLCPLSAAGTPLAALDEQDLWLLGPAELELLALNEAAADSLAPGSPAPSPATSPDARVSLRSLFRRSSGGPAR